MASAWSVTSAMLKRAPRMTSPHRAPSRVAHWKALINESLISLRYCTPRVVSKSVLGPVVSGPQHQILRDSSGSQPKRSESSRPSSLASVRMLMPPLSTASARPSGKGSADTHSRLCLLGDLARHASGVRSVTVSLNEVTGSDWWNSTRDSLARSSSTISRWSSPAAATIISPVASSMEHWTHGSVLISLRRPSASLGTSAAF